MGAFDGLRGDQVAHGYWGPHTGTIDWCESNYSHTPYIAEFINTLTNIPVILLGLYGATASYLNGVNGRYVICYLGLSLIGIGSTGFHASLRWEWQLMDELPMIYVVSWSAYLCFDTLPSFRFRFGLFGPTFILAWCIFVTFSYLYLPNPIYHQIAFASLLISGIARNAVLLRRFPPGHPGVAMITKTLSSGVVIFAAGFGVWNIDNIFCSNLRDVREYIGWPGFLLEGHALWHLMTGYGAFLIFTAAIYLQLAIKVSPDAFTFNPDSYFPIVQPVMPTRTVEDVHDAAGEKGIFGGQRLPKLNNGLSEKSNPNGQVRLVQGNGIAKHGIEVASVVLSERIGER